MSESDLVENYYEHMVFSQLEDEPAVQERQDMNYLADVACVALNQLPPRYIRHEIDTSFYITPTDHQQMEMAVQKAIYEAIVFIDQRKDKFPDGTSGKNKL